ncbi:MAG: carbohydrate ABC transporter substrate-binding protein [Anaerolineae bacterium]|nr:carbohydrate ABC transporter substrate-binding protein [Anaerolineae bacterium]
MSDDTQNTQKKSLSRRDFLKLTSTAALAGVASPQLSKLSFPNVLKGAKMELKFLTWFWTEPGRSDAWRAMIKKFHEAQSDIHINEAGYGENDYFKQILIQAKSGKIDGDMFTETPDGFLRLMKDGHTTSLEDVVKKAGVTLDKAQDMLRKDGQIHGLDIVTVRFGLLYNKAMFDKAGVGEPKNMDDWVAGVKALTKKPNQFGIFSPHVAKDPFTTWFVLQQWAVLFDGVWAKGQTPMLTSEPVINGIKLFKTMYEYMPQGTEASATNKMFGASQIAQMMVVSAAVNEWKTSTDDPNLYGNLRSAKPFWPGGKAITRIHPICVNANTDKDKQDAAKEFIAWLYKKENYQELLERCLDVIPAIEGGIRKEYRDSLTWADGYDAAAPITVPETLGDFVFFNDELGNVVIPHFQDVLTGTASVEDAMGEAQKEAEALAKRVFSS